MVELTHFLHGSEDDFVLLVQSKGSGGDKNVSNVGLLRSGVGVEVEHVEELFDVLGREDGVFGGDLRGESSFE